MTELMAITLRPLGDQDQPFLFELYCDSRADEMAAWGWSDAQRQAFLEMQFRAQRRHYDALGLAAQQSIVCRDDRPIGWLAVVRDTHAVRLADIALFASERNQGIGSTVIAEIQAEAFAARQPVQLQVDRTNRAARLYYRLGFRVVDDNHVYLTMEWTPAVN